MRLHEDHSQITLGAGTFGDEVNVFVQSQGEYYVNGLSCTQGSVVGPIFGGGLVWTLAHQYGTMADNVLGFRFMDYTGRVFAVNETSEPSLFWALRGGGGQLGVVVEVTMKVHNRTGHTMNTASYLIPSRKQEFDAVVFERIGMFYETLPENVGVWTFMSIFEGVVMHVACELCDIEALVVSYFTGAREDVGMRPITGDGRDIQQAYQTLRQQTSSDWHEDATEPILFEELRTAKTPFRFGGNMLTNFTSEVTAVYSEALAEPSVYFSSLVLSAHLGKGLDDLSDHAGSNLKGSKVFYALLNYGGDSNAENIYRDFHRGMATVSTAVAEYWNYKNKYTSEEFAFTYNFKRIREVRKQYDPDGIFALPTRRNEGSSYVDTCFGPYHCSANGQLATSSKTQDPATGCECICESGWSGSTCNQKE
jgi:FAD/FMN-containing dehydrogenase